MGPDGNWHHALVVTRPALLVAPPTYLQDIRDSLAADGVIAAVRRRDTPSVFDRLIAVSQFQGISDRSAAAFIASNGLVGWHDIARSLSGGPACPRLRSFWGFDGCGYRKTAATCAEPNHLAGCALPRHPARKGTLIQAAYALFLFIRDICDSDLIDWIDRRLAESDLGRDVPDRALHMGAALLGPLRGIFGISDKVWSMALADLLLVSDPKRERWITTGASMVVVDSLLHNHFHRTGILRRFDAEHPYGPRCYAAGGCSDLIRSLAERIDAREFNPDFPACFPRFIQFSIWRLCSTSELDICNGTRIDDRHRCGNTTCPVYDDCDRIALHGATCP